MSAQLGKGTNGKDGDTDGTCPDLVSKRETENKQELSKGRDLSVHDFPSVEAGVCLGSPLLPQPQEALSQPTCPAPWDAEAGEAPTAGPGPAHGEHRGRLTGAVPSLPVSSCRALSVGTSFLQVRGIKAPPSLATFHLGALNRWPPPLRGSILHI